MKKYIVSKINIFEEEVFDNVAITVCAFQFKQKKQKTTKTMSKVTIYPQQKINTYDFTELVLPKSLTKGNINIQVRRVVSNIAMWRTKILINCIDNINEKIGAKIITKEITQKKSTRHNFVVCTNRSLSLEDQKVIVYLFNKKLATIREHYGSLILPYFLGFGRKRLPFKWAYNLLSNLM